MHDSKNDSGQAQSSAIIFVLLLLIYGGAFLFWKFQVKRAAYLEALREEEQTASIIQASEASHQQPGSNRDQESHELAIRQVLLSQQQAWNDGKIEQFMESYWKSKELTFSSDGKLTRTWQATLENYKKRYTSRREMGKLSFSNLEVTPLGDTAAFVLGEWHLTREHQDLGGNFTLIFRHLDGQWVIVHDHTSRSEQEEEQ